MFHGMPAFVLSQSGKKHTNNTGKISRKLQSAPACIFHALSRAIVTSEQTLVREDEQQQGLALLVV